jgi:CRP/FNR family transcriptional regulator, anaerobic regulatory protein
MLSADQADGGYPAFGALERAPEANAPMRSLARNEVLFETGDIKTNIYRVETGALCIYATRQDLTLEVIEFVLAGDVVGIGFLERHANNARATVETKVKCFPLDAADRLIKHDDRAKARFDEAVQREFAFRRDGLINAGRDRPVVRLAAFLVALSHRNREEGRDPTLVDDALDCAVVADYLALSVDLLALALLKLEMQGLVQSAPRHGLQINDFDALEALANEGSDAPLPTGVHGDRRAIR